MEKFIKENWLSLAAVLMVLGPLQEKYLLPFAYYQMMNWVVVLAALATAWRAKKSGSVPVAWLFVFVAIVFNPITPIHLTPQLWRYADMVCAAIFAVSIYSNKSKKD